MKQLLTYINTNPAKIIGIIGPAGSGKSTLAKQFITNYELDSCFIGSSADRKLLLEAKSKHYSSYIDMCGMTTWWDYDKAYDDVVKLKEKIFGQGNIDGFYGNKLIINGAIFDNKLFNLCDLLVFIDIPQETRYNRLIERDKHKRTFKEIMVRWLTTEYAENLNYTYMFNNFKNKIVVIDHNYNFTYTDLKFLNETQYIPFPIG